MLTTLATVKGYLRIPSDDTSNDAILTQLIASVSDMIEKFCNRKLGKADYTEKLIGNDSRYIHVTEYPVTAVTSVSVDDIILDPSVYEVTSAYGALYRDDIPWKNHNNKKSITVNYTAGYVLPDSTTETRTLPYDIEQAAISWISIFFMRRGDEHLKSEKIGPLSSDFITDGIPPHIENILKRHRKVASL